MTAIEGFPLPPTALHDEDGNHIPPRIKEWRQAADPDSPHYEMPDGLLLNAQHRIAGSLPDRALRGSEVERDQQQKALFAEHLMEHRRRGEPAVVVESL